ncbi:MAG: hypothetical protein NT076_01850 [Candidatus Pacearchaeota archaeon]|nr:hypothetical protein [Candidatus Pacearchaeota archaeon]
MKRERKGEITTAWLITVIFIVIGLVILFILLSRFVKNAEISKETCHESVIFRATMPAEVQSYVPLKCKTAKYCLTTNLFAVAKCSEYAGVASEVTTVRVKDKTDVEQFMAREMLDCWSMMGEGKVSLFTQYFAVTYGFGSVYPSCTICSRIAFDSDLKKQSFINQIDLGLYMRTHKVPEKDVSYADYFASENGQISVGQNYNNDAMKTDLGSLQTEISKGNDKLKESVKGDKDTVAALNQKIDANYGEIKIEKVIKEGVATEEKNPAEIAKYIDPPAKVLDPSKNNQAAIVFMQITSPDGTDALKNLVNDVLGIGTLSFFVSPTITTRTLWWAGTSALKHPVITAVLVIGGVAIQQGSVAANRAVTAGYCGDVSVGKEARDGCSVVRMVNYDLQQISQYCQAVESIP